MNRGIVPSVLLACAVAAAGCGRETPTQPSTFALSGRVQLIGHLTASDGRSLGTRVVSDADGVPVDLFHANALVASTHTTDGVYRFAGLAPGGYFVRASIFGSLSAWSNGLTIANRDVAAANPIVLASVGALYPAPNPVDSGTVIVFSATSLGSAVLRVLAMDGAAVRRLYVTEMPSPGLYLTHWNCLDDQGAPVAPGYYWMTFDAGTDQRAQLLIR